MALWQTRQNKKILIKYSENSTWHMSVRWNVKSHHQQYYGKLWHEKYFVSLLFGPSEENNYNDDDNNNNNNNNNNSNNNDSSNIIL